VAVWLPESHHTEAVGPGVDQAKSGGIQAVRRSYVTSGVLALLEQFLRMEADSGIRTRSCCSARPWMRFVLEKELVRGGSEWRKSELDKLLAGDGTQGWNGEAPDDLTRLMAEVVGLRGPRSRSVDAVEVHRLCTD